MDPRPNHIADLNSTVSLEMIWVEPGTFTMGSPETEEGRGNHETQYEVTLTQGFYLGKYEVTQAQYEAVMQGNTYGLMPRQARCGQTQTARWRRCPGKILAVFLTCQNAQRRAIFRRVGAFMLSLRKPSGSMPAGQARPRRIIKA